MDFQFESAVDGEMVRVVSMVDEHARISSLNIVDRSMTADRLIEGLDKAFSMVGCPPLVLRMDHGPEFISEALRPSMLDRWDVLHSAGTPWNNGFIE
ncbi:transposase family protein [Rhodococcus pyridinivorans]|uniref:integrase catalytic domain-containing protein n=1 Tax=Rhodococcus pyridinivorans TaxID=103816 RepID=UPI0021643B22|nr:transposase family protein [Rhodococcus pyridinivorans]UVT26258.1 transposase family protein [Rhodococcus pyridinivorans]